MKHLYTYAEGCGIMRIPAKDFKEFFSKRSRWRDTSIRIIWWRYCDIPEDLRS